MPQLTGRLWAPAVVLACLCGPVSALERDARNALQYVGGIYSSILIHELGHAGVGKAFGASDIRIKIPSDSLFGGITHLTPPQGGFTSAQAKILAASGLVSANLIGELVIQREGLHRSPYAQSLLGTALISNLTHVYSYYTKVRGQSGYTGNDIDKFELSGGNPHLLSVGLLAYTAWSLHRASKRQIPLFGVQVQF